MVSLGVADEDGKDADSEGLICSSEEGVLNDGTMTDSDDSSVGTK